MLHNVARSRPVVISAHGDRADSFRLWYLGNVNVRAFHLPQIACRSRLENSGSITLELPVLDRSAMVTLTGALQQAARSTLATIPTDELLPRLQRIAEHWLDPDFGPRRDAELLLAETTGYSPAMLRHGLSLHFAPLVEDAIGRLMDIEIGARQRADACRGSVITHVLSGNIPGLAAAPTLLGLAAKSAVLLKAAAGEPLFPALFAASIASLDPELGRCVAAVYWPGGDVHLEESAFAGSEVVTAAGSDAAIASIAARVKCRFIGHGHRISFAAVGRSATASETEARWVAERLAADVSLWDQQGCLSPQLCFYETGGAISVQTFAGWVGDALDRWAQELPPRSLSLDERAAVARFRAEAEWAPGGMLLAGEDTRWTVALEPDSPFRLSCLNRCLRLIPLANLDEIALRIEPHRPHLEACGLAETAPRRQHLEELLARGGVHRICEIGEMQRPTLAWRQGGRPRFADYLV